MTDKYYIPISFSSIISNNARKLDSDVSSVRQFIYLILSTRQGDFAFDRKFGCNFWNLDFDLAMSDNSWMQSLENELSEIIKRYEPRIYSDFELKVINQKVDETSTRQRFSITLKRLRLKETNESIEDIDYSILFSPLSMEA